MVWSWCNVCVSGIAHPLPKRQTNRIAKASLVLIDISNDAGQIDKTIVFPPTEPVQLND